MKRSDALAPLSRDHQHGLYAALRLQRAADATLAEAVASLESLERLGTAISEAEAAT